MSKISPSIALATVEAFGARLVAIEEHPEFLEAAVEMLRETLRLERAEVLVEEETSAGGEPATRATAIPLATAGRSFGRIVLENGPGRSIADAEWIIALHLASQIAACLERREARAEVAAAAARIDHSDEQLAAYARDIRETYLGERKRANELAQALEELHKTYLATVKGMAAAVEAKDEYTAGHLVRVTSYGMRIAATVLGHEPTDEHIHYGFLLHDVGKLAVPDEILKKPGALTTREWEVMRRHAEMGYRILRDVPFLHAAREIVYAHHERWDGGGYPRGLQGDEIPLGARIFPVADSFDAMTSDRPYRRALDLDVALLELDSGRGTQFWPDAVDAFMSIPRDELAELAAAREILLDGDAGA